MRKAPDDIWGLLEPSVGSRFSHLTLSDFILVGAFNVLAEENIRHVGKRTVEDDRIPLN